MKQPDIYETTYRRYLERIAGIDLASRAEVLGAKAAQDGLEVDFYQTPYRVSASGVLDRSGKRASFDICVLLCCYVLQCPQTSPPQGEWVAYRNFKDSGPLGVYFADNIIRPIGKTFSGNVEGLEAVCGQMGGRVVAESGFDLAMQFEMLPRIPVYFRFNDRDDIFPAEASFLFRESTEKYLDMECLAIGGAWLARHLVKGE